jgi:hypothetical protein
MAGTRITTTGVLYINGRQVEDTFNNLRRSTTQLERQLRNLTPGTEEFVRTSEELRRVRTRFNEVRQEINETNNALSSWKDIFKGNIAADFFSNVTSKAMELGAQLKQRVEDLVKIKSTLSSLDSSLKGGALDRASATVQSIADTYGKSVEEIEGAVKGLNVQTKDTNVSLDLIKKGFEAGADASGEMLTQLKEYPTMMKDAKVSAEEMIAIMSQSEKMGIYDDKGIDAIKEGMLRVREGTKSAKDAMTALGIDTTDVYKKISSGALTYFDVLKIVSGKIKETGADSRLTGTAIADIFGGPGEDAGFEYLSQLKDINLNLNDLTKTTDLAVIAKRKELEANERLNGIWVQLTGTAGILSRAYSTLKTGLADVLEFTLNIKQAKVSDEYLSQEVRLRYLKSQLDNTNISHNRKLEIYRELKAQWPQYYSGLDLEKMKHDEITKAINYSIDALGRKYKAQVFQEQFDKTSGDFTEKYAEAIELEAKGMALIGEAMKKFPELQKYKFKSGTTVNQLRELDSELQKIFKTQRGDGTIFDAKSWQSLDTGLQRSVRATSISLANANQEAYKADVKRIKDQKALSEMQSKLLPDVFKPTPTISQSNDRDLDAEAAAAKAAEAARKKALKDSLKSEKDKKKELEEMEKAEKESHENLLKLQAEYQNSKSEIIEDEFQKEVQKEVDRRNQEEDAFEKKITDLQDRKSKSKSSTEIKDIDASIDILNKTNQQKEEEHRFKLLTIQQKWDAKLFEEFIKSEQKRIEEARRVREEEIIDVNSVEEAKHKLLNTKYLKLTDLELKNIKTLEQAKAALREDADREMLAAQLVSLEGQKKVLESQLKGLTGPAADKLKENLREISKAITQTKSALNGKGNGDTDNSAAEKLSAKEKVDILGFSVQDWEDTFTNIETLEDGLKAAAAIFQAMGNAAGSYAELQRALGEREIKNFEKVQTSKKSELDRQLALGLISQQNYKAQTELLDAELANKQAEIEYKQAKAEKTSRLFSAVGATAMGIANSLAIGGPVGIAMAAIVGILGAVQIGAIAAQPLPEPPSFAEGGYFEGFTGDSNLPADASGERPVGLAKLHIKEFVVPRWMTEHPVISKRVNELDYIRRTKNIPEFADGGFVDNTTNGVAGNIPGASNSNDKYYGLLSRLEILLQYLNDEGVIARFAEDAKTFKKLDRGIKDYQTLENKNKH